MTTVILLAGGIGSRMNSSTAKQHIVIQEHQIIEYTIMAFSNCELVDRILIVSNPKYLDMVESLKSRYPLVYKVVPGGNTRMESVYNAIMEVKDELDDDKIIISDAARPCITKREIVELISALDKYIAVTTGIISNETILKTDNHVIAQIIQRDGIIRQTSPEGYRLSALKWLYINNTIEMISKYRNIGIDQLHASGAEIGIIESNPLNFKITTPYDLVLFDSVLKQGFDNIINS